jgi:hypothetical protein
MSRLVTAVTRLNLNVKAVRFVLSAELTEECYELGNEVSIVKPT